MQTWPEKYNYHVCPFCKSKDVRPVGVYSFTLEEYFANITQIQRTGYICRNCKRYFPQSDGKWITDRAEMRRDMKRIQEFLEGASND